MQTCPHCQQKLSPIRLLWVSHLIPYRCPDCRGRATYPVWYLYAQILIPLLLLIFIFQSFGALEVVIVLFLFLVTILLLDVFVMPLEPLDGGRDSSA